MAGPLMQQIRRGLESKLAAGSACEFVANRVTLAALLEEIYSCEPGVRARMRLMLLSQELISGHFRYSAIQGVPLRITADEGNEIKLQPRKEK